MSPIPLLLKLLSPAGQKARLSVLILHRVLPQPDPLFPGEPDARWFDELLGYLRHWFNVLPLDEATQRLAAGTLPERAAAITFDDGYADNYHVALPLLKKHGLPATVFVATGFLDGGIMWNDAIIEAVRQADGDTLDLQALALGRHEIASSTQRRKAIDAILGRIKYLEPDDRIDVVARCVAAIGADLPNTLMLTSDELRHLHAADVTIGAHTVNHPILARISSAEARREIENGKAALENLLQAPVTLFAYPNGKPGTDYLPEHVDMVRACGFSAAVSTVWGAANQTGDIHQVPRFTPWDRTAFKFGMRMAGNLFQARSVS